MITAFQSNTFQNNAFQIGATGVGWFDEWNRPRLRHNPVELEKRIKAQRGFGPRWYEELLEAQQAALTKAKAVKSKKQAAALIEAVSEANIFGLVEHKLEIERATAALNAAVSAGRITASIRNAELAAIIIRRVLDEDDEDDAEMLLLH